MGGDGLHVSLQVNAFGKFMDIVEAEEEIESLCYEVARRVLQKMSVYYRFEFERKDKFLVEMEKIFPRTVRIIPVEEGKAKSDCTILVNNFRVGNYEFKNEFAGITSDLNNQNIGYFVHLQAPCKDERAPMLLVSLIGCHYFQVFVQFGTEIRYVHQHPSCWYHVILFVVLQSLPVLSLL